MESGVLPRLYFALALSDSIFGAGAFRRREVTPEYARSIITEAIKMGTLISAVNPSHVPTLRVLRKRFGIIVPTPSEPPRIRLAWPDQLLVATLQGLPRLAGRHEYTKEEVESAEIAFALWEVEP